MKIAKNVVYLTSLIILTVILAACSSPEEKAADFVSKAGTLFEEGELAKAEIEYKNALQINKNLPDALFGLAKIKESKQEWRRVYALLMKVRELDPGHIDGRIMLTHLMLASNQLDEALIDATEILEMAPGDARSHSLMAAVQYRLENFEGALQEVAKALEIDPVNRDAILVRSRVLITQKKYNEAISILDAASKSDPTNASFQLMKIQAYQETSDKRAIEKVYLELVDQFPESDAYRNALLYQYVKDERIDDAERIMEQIIQANPNSIQEKVRFVRFKNQFRSLDDAITLVKGYINTSKGEYRYRFLLGELYENNKQIDQALKVYRSIVTDDQLQRNGLEARNKIALIELRAGNRDKAIALVKEVLAQDKNNENGLLLMARMDVADQRFEDAILNLRTALRDNPESIGALGLLGQSYDALGSSELALETYARAFKLSPGTPEVANQLARHLIRDGKLDRANEALQESVAKGNDSIDAMKILVQVKLSQNEWDEAERLAKQLQKIEGQEALSQQVLGVVYQRKKLEDASIDAFKRAHELAPTAAQPIVSLVQTYVRSGKISEARRFLNSVISVDNDNLTSYYLLGQLSLYEKKTTDAIKFFEKAIEINPLFVAGYRSLASIYLKASDSGKAVGVINQGLSQIPGQPALGIFLASIHQNQGNLSKAIEIYESLLETNPSLLVAKNNLASLLTDYAGDQASLDRARALALEFRDSHIPQFRDTYAWASVKSGVNVEEAVIILEGIVKDNNQVDVYNYHLGEAYLKNGETNNAVAYLTKAIELAKPGSDIAIKAEESLQQIN